MCQFILDKTETDPTWLDNLWTSDEANFNLNGKIYLIGLAQLSLYLSGLVNTKNVVCYSPKNGGRPANFSVETVKHPDGVMVG